jgi:hypothetical protein
MYQFLTGAISARPKYSPCARLHSLSASGTALLTLRDDSDEAIKESEHALNRPPVYRIPLSLIPRRLRRRRPIQLQTLGEHIQSSMVKACVSRAEHRLRELVPSMYKTTEKPKLLQRMKRTWTVSYHGFVED